MNFIDIKDLDDTNFIDVLHRCSQMLLIDIQGLYVPGQQQDITEESQWGSHAGSVAEARNLKRDQ